MQPGGTKPAPTPVDDLTRRAWVYLNGVGERPTKAVWDIVDRYGPVEAADRIRSRHLPAQAAEQTAARAHSLDAPALLERAAQCGARFLCPGDPEWPAARCEDLSALEFRDDFGEQTPLRPFGLWLRGGLVRPWNPRRVVSIVGTRQASDYGRHVAAQSAADCAARGIIVLSGGALGIDIAAHRASLSAGGVTAAVLACGIDTVYPSSNRDLLEGLVDNGGIISEYPPGTGTRRHRFLARNRLIAALAEATVVVEAANRSGALSTARFAVDAGRAVYAVPGNITRSGSVGCNELIAEGGVFLVKRPEMIADDLLGDREPELPNTRRNRAATVARRPTGHTLNRMRATDGLDPIVARVYEALEFRGWRRIDQISHDAGLPTSAVHGALGALLTDGLVLRDREGWRCVTYGTDGQAALLEG